MRGSPVLPPAPARPPALAAALRQRSPSSSSPSPAVVLLAGVNPMASFLQGQADYFSTLGLPQWLVQWVRSWVLGASAGGCVTVLTASSAALHLSDPAPLASPLRIGLCICRATAATWRSCFWPWACTAAAVSRSSCTH